ncbi:MAG: hypothetical protein ACFFHD_02615 [Promethearchaeota archaeon]
MPIWLRETQYEGDNNHGTIILNSQDEYDEIWGPIFKMEINWEKKERSNLLFYKETQNSIDLYNAIGLVVTEKEKDWLMSHEIVFWYGHRNKMIRKRFYTERAIHCVFYCDISEKIYNCHTSIIESMYENYKPYVLKAYRSIICH